MVNGVLVLVLAALCGWLVLFAVNGSSAAPGRTPAETRAEVLSDVKRAALDHTKAFLDVDYDNMDELTDRVLDGATGDFKKQYKTSLDSLKEAAVAQQSVSEGSVNKVGLSEVDTDSATAFVAAGSKVKNKGTKGKVEDRSWRIKLTMANEDGRWLVSQLEFVG